MRKGEGEGHTLRVLVMVVCLSIVFVEDVRSNMGCMVRKNHFLREDGVVFCTGMGLDFIATTGNQHSLNPPTRNHREFSDLHNRI